MKLLIILTIFLVSSLALCSESEKIKQLEQRIQALELQNGSKADSMGLKVKDMKGEEVGSSGSMNSMNIPLEKQKEIMKQLESFKKRKEEEMKLLKEMDEEGY